MRGLWRVAILSTIALWIAGATAQGARPEIAYLLVEAESSTVLAEQNATQPRYPASLTKVMTAYMVFRALDRGQLHLDDWITVSATAAAQPPTKLGLAAGREVPVQVLLEAMILRSANDAAVALAEAVSGNEDHFAISMTRQARELGMTQSAFRNATGLPHAGQVTTARDLVILARALIADFPAYYGYFSRPNFTYNKRVRSASSSWVRQYRGAEGFKTGFTCGSGYNLLSAASRDGRRLIGVVLGAMSSGARNAQMTQLMDQGFAASAKAEPGGLLLTALRGDMKSIAPYIFADGSCPVAVTPVKETLVGGQLPGWGLVFGSFVNRAEAQARITGNLELLKELSTAGRPAIVEQHSKQPRGYSALLVDLGEEDAGQACRHLQALGIYCLAVPPKILNSPHTYWR